MLKNVLKSKGTTKTLKKKTTSSKDSLGKGDIEETKEESIVNEDGITSKASTALTKKPVKKGKKGTKKPKPIDTMTKFFNDYGESPHLQAIEDSYVKYL
jgi:hypothetical protein